MKKPRFADGGDVKLADDEGNTLDELEKKERGWRSVSTQRWAERAGRQTGAEYYPRTREVQDSISNPVVRGLKKASTYVKEKYGDLRDDVRTAITNDDSAEFRKGQRAVREKHLGYAKGGSVKKPGKKAVMAAVMAAHQAGVQKGAAMASPRQAPVGPPPGAGAPPAGIAGLPQGPGMKAGGKVAKEKWTPPWMKKGKKFAAGGRVSGARGDGCVIRGRTKGKFC